MALWIVGLLAVVAVTAWVVRLLKDESIGRERVQARLHDAATPVLEYVFPTGEDPVHVVAALERAGYTVAVDSHDVHQVVMVDFPTGGRQAREKVRAVISAAHSVPRGEGRRAPMAVRFRDEA